MTTGVSSDHVAALFSQHVAGVFVAVLDEPIDWSDPAGHEAALDYAFDHLRLVAVNDTMCAQYGEPRDRLLGTVPRDRWGARAAEWREHMRKLYDVGQAHHTLRAPRPEGDGVSVEGEYICTYDAAGRITGHVGTQRDVTDRERIAERLRAAVASTDLGIWEIDFAADTMTFEGDRWLERFGYYESTMRPTWWRSLIHPADMIEIQAAHAAHAAGTTPVFRAEYRIRGASGDWLMMLASGTITARTADGTPLRMVGTTVDITERRRLQSRLAASERLAALGTLAAGVAHEINNPLTYIALTAELVDREVVALSESAPPARITRLRELIEQVREGSDRVRRIVRDLQSLSRIPDERITVFDPVEIIARCLAIVEHQLRHRAAVERVFGPTPRVRGDIGRIEQVFLNLLVNAAQAIPEGAADANRIRITTSTSADGRAVIEIGDTGAGIATDVIERIFDPFFTTKPIGEGTGLGLPIARNIVVGMGGDIDVTSTPGRGAVFRVLLPAAPADAVAAIADVIVPAARAIGPLRVLVVDDEAAVGASVADLLAGHDVSVETSGRAALARLRDGERFDRILCDLMMPEVSGMDLYDQLAAIDPALPARVVFVTGGAFTERARSFLARVSNPRLDKPFDLAQLLTAITGT